MKRMLSAVLTLCILSCAVSCKKEDNEFEYRTGDIEAFVYDETAENTGFNASIYTVGQISGLLECENARIEMPCDASPLNALIEAVLSQNSSGTAHDMKLEGALLSDEACLIFLTGEFPDMTEWLKLEGVLLATLKDFCGADTVAVFFNGGPVAHDGMPVTTARYIGELPDDYVEEMLSEFYKGTPPKSAFLAFVPDFNSELFYISPIGSVPYSASDPVRTKVKKTLERTAEELTLEYNRNMQPGIDACCTMVFKTKKTESGNYAVDIELTQAVLLKNDALYIARLIALSLYTNVAGIENVHFTVKDENGDIEYSPSFREAIKGLGTSMTAYYPIHTDSTLEAVHMYIESENRYNAKALLAKALSETADTLMPDISDRLQDVAISGDTALVNFSPGTGAEIMLGFINDTRCYDSPEMRERLFVHSIVNTLTELPMVEGVAFFENKETMPRLVNIYFERPIRRNPGLIAE